VTSTKAHQTMRNEFREREGRPVADIPCHQRPTKLKKFLFGIAYYPERLTGAMLDRLTHRVHIVECCGSSCPSYGGPGRLLWQRYFLVSPLFA